MFYVLAVAAIVGISMIVNFGRPTLLSGVLVVLIGIVGLNNYADNVNTYTTVVNYDNPTVVVNLAPLPQKKTGAAGIYLSEAKSENGIYTLFSYCEKTESGYKEGTILSNSDNVSKEYIEEDETPYLACRSQRAEEVLVKAPDFRFDLLSWIKYYEKQVGDTIKVVDPESCDSYVFYIPEGSDIDNSLHNNE